MTIPRRSSILTHLPVSISLLILSLQIIGADGPNASCDDSLSVVVETGDSLSANVVTNDSAIMITPVAGGTTSSLDTSAHDSAGIFSAHDVSPDTVSAGAESDSAGSDQLKPLPIPIDELRMVENKAFGVGEHLEFEISYGPIKAGSAVMEVKEIVEIDGRESYRVISTARSSRFFSAIYRVEDRVESFIDVGGLFPWKFHQKLQEGKHRANRWAVYDQVNHTVTTNREILDIPPYVQDVLSIMYYARTREMTVGDTLYIDNHAGRKVYPLAVKVQRLERVEVPAGTFDCLVVEPMLKAGGLFKHEGRIWVWLTNDRMKLPVLMKTKVIIGTVDAKLKNYRLGKIL